MPEEKFDKLAWSTLTAVGMDLANHFPNPAKKQSWQSAKKRRHHKRKRLRHIDDKIKLKPYQVDAQLRELSTSLPMKKISTLVHMQNKVYNLQNKIKEEAQATPERVQIFFDKESGELDDSDKSIIKSALKKEFLEKGKCVCSTKDCDPKSVLGPVQGCMHCDCVGE